MYYRLSTAPLGTLYGVSVGPGDPELITVRGLNRIRQVSVIAFPEGLHGQPGIAEQIAAQWIGAHQTRISLQFPYVHDPDVLIQAWTDAAELIWQPLSQGKDVAFLCEGDVSVYSTFSHLATALKKTHPRVPVEAIPGISSPTAAAAVMGDPLITQGQRLAVLPALYHISDLETALNTAEVVVLMKLKSVYEQAWAILKHRHLLSQSYVVEWATWPQQKIYADLGDRPFLDLSYFSVLVVQQGTPMPQSMTRIGEDIETGS